MSQEAVNELNAEIARLAQNNPTLDLTGLRNAAAAFESPDSEAGSTPSPTGEATATAPDAQGSTPSGTAGEDQGDLNDQRVREEQGEDPAAAQAEESGQAQTRQDDAMGATTDED